MFYRIFAADNYSIGEKIANFIVDFKKSYSEVNKGTNRIADPVNIS